MAPKKDADTFALWTDNFPRLKEEDVYLTDDGYNDGYNCVGWSVRDTGHEDDIDTLVNMVKFYKSRGYEEVEPRSAAADIDLMSSDGYRGTHATTRYTDERIADMPADLWESKMYPYGRITHGRFDLEDLPEHEKKDPAYKNQQKFGKVVKSFRKSAVADGD